MDSGKIHTYTYSEGFGCNHAGENAMLYSVLFDIESFDYGYYDEGSEGLKVAVVHHLDMPIIRQRAFHVAPGTENQIPVTPTLYTATEQVGIKEERKETCTCS